MRRFSLLALLLLACSTSLRGEVRGGGETKLSVELDLAETEEERRTGLRAYASLSPEQGLLLVFPGPSEVCITNAGVAFGIDAVFVDAGDVTAVESFAAGEATPRCQRADEVLEVAVGVASRVEVGDRFVWQ
ncbi:MAG: uncharacterized membrane protein (UPF0127 family) [Polyangiales bacterium]